MTERHSAGIYVRISKDQEGLELGVQRQQEDLSNLAVSLGLDVRQVYKDNDISASTRSLKRRPGYEAMLADARAGEINVILAYTSSRLTRKPRENEDLIELSERHGVTFRYLRSPAFDLNTADGRNVARILAANDAAESERISERVQRAAQQRAVSGGYHGGARPWGYLQDSEQNRTIDPEAEKLIREAARRLLAGETLYGICSDWNERGLRTSTGSIWRSKTLKRAVMNPALIGKRSYRGQLFPGAWPAILDEDTFDRLSALLMDPSRMLRDWTGHDTSRKHPLGGLVVCGLCGKKLVSMTARRKPDGSRGDYSFFCSKQATGGCGHMRIAMGPLEEWVLAQVTATLEGLQLPDHEPTDVADTRGVRNDIDRLEQSLRQLDSDYYVEGLLDRRDWLDRRSRVSERLQNLQEQLIGLTIQTTKTIIPAGTELISQWTTRDAMWKRTMLATIVDHIKISPHPKHLASTLTRRRGETDGELQQRRQEHQITVLKERVDISWRV